MTCWSRSPRFNSAITGHISRTKSGEKPRADSNDVVGLKVVRYRMHGKTIVQSTQVTAPMADIFQRLGIPLPKKILEVSE